MTERTRRLEADCRRRGIEAMPTHFDFDYHSSALSQFKDLPHAEKLARSMAYAIENQPVFAYEGDGIGGRVYYKRETRVPEYCPDLMYDSPAYEEFKRDFPDADELVKNHLIPKNSRGHISWNYKLILEYGVTGLKQKVSNALLSAKDIEAREFYEGVLILLDALLAFNDKHIEEYERLGNRELADLMRKVPRYPAESFREAVQAYFMQHIVVMRENPFGGNSPGRLDYYLWPYLERDLMEGRCTEDDARELIDELFLRIDERIYERDMWGETIVVGGTKPDGTSAVNPLTYIMVRSYMELNITHPMLYIRLPKDPDEEILQLTAEYMLYGSNRAQILYDPSVINALTKSGVPYTDAVDYYCGGCMEVGIQGKNSDFLYIGWQNTPKLLELMITGGVCLKTGDELKSFKSRRGLIGYHDFESFYADFIAEAKRITHISLKEQDYFTKHAAKNRPSYLISSMLDDCIERGRNMHSGGVRYHDYGATPLAMPNTIDSLFAIKKAVFDEKICTADELVSAVKANYAGYEKLQKKLKALPKYGMDNDEVDALARRVMQDFADMYLSFETVYGGKGKPIILTFVYAPIAAADLGARADGANAGSMVAQGITPQSSAMSAGITAAINSVGKMPFEKFSGGASTMWDFDESWINEPLLKAIIKTFTEKNGHIFQGNTTSTKELIAAQKNPADYHHLIVRVGGYSARFTGLSTELQDEIINRVRHCR